MKATVKYLILTLLLSVSFSASAQKKLSADVEIKQVSQGKVITITKSVYCSNNGRLVVHFHSPQDYYMTTNLKGEARIYIPQTNQVYNENSGTLSSGDELLHIFMNGRVDDMGLGLHGYRLQSTSNEEGKIKKTFTSTSDSSVSKVEIVFDSFLPIYMAYYDAGGKTVNKTYMSNYTNVGKMKIPSRTTSISYVAKDSTITRTIYSNIKADANDSEFEFEIPSDAKR